MTPRNIVSGMLSRQKLKKIVKLNVKLTTLEKSFVNKYPAGRVVNKLFTNKFRKYITQHNKDITDDISKENLLTGYIEHYRTSQIYRTQNKNMVLIKLKRCHGKICASSRYGFICLYA